MAEDPTPAPPGGQLSDADSLMCRIAADPVLRSPILVVGLLDQAPEPKGITATFEHAGTLLPGLQARIVAPATGLGRSRWVPAPDDRVGHHIRWIRATRDDLRGVLDQAELDVTAPFDPERPAWSLTVVEGLIAGHAAFLLRFHHAITDGMGGLQAAGLLFDRRRHPTDRTMTGGGVEVGDAARPGRRGRAASPALVHRAAGAAGRMASELRSAARDPLGTASGSLRLARSLAHLVGAAPDGSPLLAGRGLDRHLHVFDVPLPQLRAAAKVAGGTVNDALLAAVGGAFRAYHDHHGVSVPTMSVTMPIDRRRPGDGVSGNRFVPARFTLPIDEPDASVRVRIAAAISRSWQEEPALAMSDVVAGALNRLPGPVVTRVFGGMLRTIDVDVVDLAGLAEPAYVGGARIERLWAFAPPTGAAFSVTLLSHVDTACFAVACDRAAVREPELLDRCLEAGLDEVLAPARRPRADHEPEDMP